MCSVQGSRSLQGTKGSSEGNACLGERRAPCVLGFSGSPEGAICRAALEGIFALSVPKSELTA